MTATKAAQGQPRASARAVDPNSIEAVARARRVKTTSSADEECQRVAVHLDETYQDGLAGGLDDDLNSGEDAA